MTEAERREDGIDSLPYSLEEAIADMSGSQFVKGVLGQHIFDKYIEAKTGECYEYNTRVSQWEVNSYLTKY